MLVTYRLTPADGRFTVQAFATGLLSFVGHSPTFAVRDFEGDFVCEPETLAGARLQLLVQAASLTVLDNLSPKDRQEMETRMRTEVLEVAKYPLLGFRSTEIGTNRVAGNQYRLEIIGRLTLHGVTNSVQAEAQLELRAGALRLTGGFPLRLSDYRIKPVVALAGALKLKDTLQVSFDLVGRKEG
jgi:polyisoprenoid-binding protein YceI